MPAEHTFPLIHVAGTAYELGYQHGAQAADLIRRYLLLIERVTGRPRDRLCQRNQEAPRPGQPGSRTEFVAA